MNDPAKVTLRPATGSDAAAIARLMRAALGSFDWMPVIHTPDEDLAFIRDIVLPRQLVTVAEAGTGIAGFIAVSGDWVEQLYLDPAWTGQGIGSRLLIDATAAMPVVKLHCFQSNTGARRFYERHGFRVEAFGDGSANEEGLPDILYVLRR
ncbi:GNAT family N-acetyltransferase [Mesorhizobium amorphae]|uniref:GNAT family N-acetyltransferase n=1 Tax=Mesorhizobium amorphae TaxID=71433 RepID=UPI00178177FB|nr:GNAT family N-acetyltransferase [Mesorhizobium amorphae]